MLRIGRCREMLMKTVLFVCVENSNRSLDCGGTSRSLASCLLQPTVLGNTPGLSGCGCCRREIDDPR